MPTIASSSADRLGHYHDATERLEEAFILAERRGDDLRAFDAAIALVQVAGSHLAAPDEGFRWVRLADAKRWRLGLEPDDPRVATLMLNLAGIHALAGQYDDAERSYQHAVSIRERAMGAEHPDVAAGLYGLAGLYSTQARYAEALYREAQVSIEAALGPQHLDLGVVLGNLAEVLNAQGRHDEAWAVFRRVLSIYRVHDVEEHPNIAMSWAGMSEIEIAREAFDPALERLERALAMHEALDSSVDDLGRSRFAMARAQWGRGRRARARRLVERAEREVSTPSLRAEFEAWLAEHR